MADAYARLSGERRRRDAAPGLRAHQRDDRHHRGGQEPHAAARARRRDRRGRGAPTSASTRTRWRPRSARCPSGSRPPETARRGHRPGAAHGRHRAADRRAQPAAGRAGRRPADGALVVTGAPPPPPRPARRDEAVASLAALLAGGRAPGLRRGPRRGGAREPAARRSPSAAVRCSRPRRSRAACSPASAGRSTISGGFASPLAAELIGDADLVVGWGCALNMWTMRHGRAGRRGRDASCRSTSTPTRSAPHRPVDLGVVGDVAATARAVARPRSRQRIRRGAPRSWPSAWPARCAGATCPTTTRAAPARSTRAR